MSKRWQGGRHAWGRAPQSADPATTARHFLFCSADDQSTEHRKLQRSRPMSLVGQGFPGQGEATVRECLGKRLAELTRAAYALASIRPKCLRQASMLGSLSRCFLAVSATMLQFASCRVATNCYVACFLDLFKA